jgi:hypothetical protein
MPLLPVDAAATCQRCRYLLTPLLPQLYPSPQQQRWLSAVASATHNAATTTTMPPPPQQQCCHHHNDDNVPQQQRCDVFSKH